MVGRRADHGPVLVDELDGVLDVGLGIGRRVGRVAGAGPEGPVPAGEGIGVGVVGGLGRVSRPDDLVAVMVGDRGNDGPVLVEEGHRVVDVGRLVGRRVGRVAGAGHHRAVPAGERVGVGLVRALGRVRGGRDRVAVMVRGRADHGPVLVDELHREIIDNGGVNEIFNTVVCEEFFHVGIVATMDRNVIGSIKSEAVDRR